MGRDKAAKTWQDKDKESGAEAGRKTYLVDPNWFPPQLDLVHDLAGILRILLREELAKAIALVGHRYSILWKVHINCNENVRWESSRRAGKHTHRLDQPVA